MQDELIIAFEKMLDQKALELLPQVIPYYHNKNTFSFGQKVNAQLPRDLKPYWCDIELRIIRYIYLKEKGADLSNLQEDYENEKDYLYQYYHSCQKKPYGRIDHKITSEILAHTLVDTFPSNKKRNLAALAFQVIKKMNRHYDSVDIRCVILLLEKELASLGYIITSIDPILLEKTKA